MTITMDEYVIVNNLLIMMEIKLLCVIFIKLNTKVDNNEDIDSADFQGQR